MEGFMFEPKVDKTQGFLSFTGRFLLSAHRNLPVSQAKWWLGPGRPFGLCRGWVWGCRSNPQACHDAAPQRLPLPR